MSTIKGPLWWEGLPTHAVQTWKVLAEAPGRLDHWQVTDAGPEEGEAGFTDHDWFESFNEKGGRWQGLVSSQDVDGMWAMLEDCLVKCH